MAVTNVQLMKSITDLLAGQDKRHVESQKEHLDLKNSIEKLSTKLDGVIDDVKDIADKLTKLEGKTLHDDDSLRVKVTKNSDDIKYIKRALERQKAGVWKVTLSVIGTIISAIVLYFIFDKK